MMTITVGRNFWVTVWIAVIIASGVLTTGCYDRQELESEAFVTTIGLDQAPGGQIDCTMRIALPKNPSSGGGGGGGGGGQPLAGSGPITVRGHTLMEAMKLANSSIERNVTLSHLTLIMFGEPLARQGLSQYMQPMIRFREFRRTTLMAVCRGSAKEVMNAEKPMLDQSAGRLADSISQVGAKTGLFAAGNLHEFLLAVEDGHHAPLLPVFAVNESVRSDSKGENADRGAKVSYDAGRVSRTGGNPVECIGDAVFKGEKLVDFLDGQEAEYVGFLRGQLKSTKMDFRDFHDRKFWLSLYVRRARFPKFNVSLSNPVKISVRIPLEADVLSSSYDYSQPNNRAQVERDVANQMSRQFTSVMRKVLNKDAADIIPVSDQIRPQFQTHPEYKQFPWEERIKSAEIQTQVELHIRRFGVQLMPIVSR